MVLRIPREAPSDYVPDLATGRYQEWTPTDGLPVITTVGYPRFWRGPELQDGKALAPEGALRFLRDRAKFSRLYTIQLERLGVPRLLYEFWRVNDAAGPGRLVLLCFDDLRRPGQWCHRTVFARWWYEQTGQLVPELHR